MERPFSVTSAVGVCLHQSASRQNVRLLNLLCWASIDSSHRHKIDLKSLFCSGESANETRRMWERLRWDFVAQVVVVVGEKSSGDVGTCVHSSDLWFLSAWMQSWNTLSRWCTRMSLFFIESLLILPVGCWFEKALHAFLPFLPVKSQTLLSQPWSDKLTLMPGCCSMKE